MTRFRPNKLYKNPREGRVMGVCAGIADYFDIKPLAIRILTVLLMFAGFFGIILVAYFVLGFVLESKPRELYENPEEDRFWKDVRTQPDYTAVDLRKRFRDIESRTRRMEAYMTSKRFRLDRELRDLED